MLNTIRDFKQRLVVAMIANKEDTDLDREINVWLIRNKLQILDMLDDAITDYEKRRFYD